MTVPSLTDDQIAAARSVDLLSYLQAHEPGSIKKSGPNEYCLREHNSLKISNSKWFWFSRGFGSNNALDYLVQVRGMDFTQAVETLADGRNAPVYQAAPLFPEREKPRPLLALPMPNQNNHRATAYLMGRGIDKEIVDYCIAEKTLYESRERHNCVFIGRNAKGKVRFAAQRSTSGDWKRDLPGSDKRYGFCIASHKESSVVNVFESPIDALSFACYDKSNWGDGYQWRDQNYLSLGGVSSLALIQFLTDRPEISDVRLRLDNDAPGIAAMARITAELKENPLFEKLRLMSEPSPIGKDWNDLIQHMKAQSRPAKDAAVTI